MLNKILESISYLSDKFIRDNIHVNQSYRALKWSYLEKIIVYGSVHYAKMMIILLSFFTAIFIIISSGEKYIKPFAAQFLPEWKTILDTQMNLLGGQLTIIGIVYPMVVGLVSVIFQRKSARKIVQAAYQTYSGFMFAGLSGLCLSGFILCGLMLRTFIGNYNYAIICGITIIWMIFNIVLSVWFFVQSLSVLDDRKRERMVLRYLTADVLSSLVKEQLHNVFLANLVKYKIITNGKYSNLNFDDYSFDKDYSVVTSKSKKQEVIKDIYARPLKATLWSINKFGRIKKEKISIALFSKLESPEDRTITPLFKVKNINPNHILIKALALCFYTGSAKARQISSDRIIKGLMGDGIDALANGDINAFEEGIEGFCRDITSFTDAFNFKYQYQTDNLLLLADNIFWDRSFTDVLYTEIYQLFQQAIMRIDISQRFYAFCMRVPRILCSKREGITLKEINLALSCTYYSWDVLVRWGHANAGRLDLTQRQSYESLLMNFVEIWESWPSGLEFLTKKSCQHELYHDTLKAHLFTLPDIVVCAVISGESSSIDWAVDMMNRWLHVALSSPDNHYTGLYSWQEFLISQTVLDGKIILAPEMTPSRKQVEIPQLLDVFYKNTLTDLRLLTVAFIISKPNVIKHEKCLFAVNTLLSGNLVENTGGLERLSEGINKSSDILDVYIRMISWDRSDGGDSNYTLSNILRALSSNHGKSLVSGRTYMGGRLAGIDDLIPQLAELVVLRCEQQNIVSSKMKAIIRSDLLPYRILDRIQRNLKTLQHAIIGLTSSAFITEDAFTDHRKKASELIQEYLDLFSDQIQQSIIRAPVSETILEKMGKDISEIFSENIKKVFPFSLFDKISVSPIVRSNIKKRVIFLMDKQDMTDKFAQKIHGLEENRVTKLVQEHMLDLLELLSHQPAKNHCEASSFPDILSMVQNYDGLQEGDWLIVCDARLYAEYNVYRANTLDCIGNQESSLFYDDQRGLKIQGKEHSCSLYIRPHFSSFETILVNSAVFNEYKIKQESENIFTFNAESVDGNPMQVALHSQYEGEALFSGQVKVRFTLRNDPVMIPTLLGEDA